MIWVVSAAICINGRLLLQQRDPLRSDYGWYWETPGGKIERGELPKAALQRELREELGIDALVGEEVGSVVFEAGQGGIVTPFGFLLYRVTGMSKMPRAQVALGLGWFMPLEIEQLALTPASERFVGELCALARDSGLDA